MTGTVTAMGKGTTRRLRLVILLMAAVSSVWQVRVSWDVLETLGLSPPRAASPLGLAPASARVTWVDSSAAATGVEPGDSVLFVDGKPLTGHAILSVAVASRQPGEMLGLVVRDGTTSQQRVAEVRLRAMRPPTAGVKVMLGTLMLAMPWLCLGLGTWVVWLRPTDHRAWLLFVLMLAFPQMMSAGIAVERWSDALRAPGLAYRMGMRVALGVSIMLFGIHLPERTPWDVKVPWIKWAINVPAVMLGLVLTAYDVASSESLVLAARMHPVAAAARWPFEALFFLQIGCFFAALGPKMATLESADARRRVRLVMGGASFALAPPGIVAALALYTRRGFADLLPVWLLPVVVLPLLLFPLTLAYVIVVHRAMDTRMALRQGVQYALARNGARALLLITVAGTTAFATASVLDAERELGAKVLVVALSAGTLVLVSRIAEPLARWVDRRFFREALDAEHLLLDVSEKIRTMLDAGPVLEIVAHAVSKSLHVPRVAVLLRGNGHYDTAHALGFDASPDTSFGAEAATPLFLQRSGQPERVYADDPASWIHHEPGMTDAERARLDDLGARLLVPLATPSDLLGFVSLGEKRSEEPYSGSDLRVLKTLASQTTLALENARLAATVARDAVQRERMTRELNLAREVQQRLFPEDPQIPWLDCSGYCRPALGVGGDYYDFIPLDDGRFALAFADISGKGFGAALLMANLQASVRGQLLVADGDLAGMVSRVNRLVYDASDSNRYATFFCALVDPGAGRLTYVNAGHNPPFVLRRDGTIDRLESGGTVVGLLESFPWVQDEVDLAPGELLVAYTDGISEAMNPAEEEYGEERLALVLSELRELGPTEVIAGVLRQVDAFVAGAKQHDDMTLVVTGLR